MFLYWTSSPHQHEVPMARRIFAFVVLLLSSSILIAQPERVDSAAVALIKAEGLQHSQVMSLLSSLCDVYSPRLSWSPEYARGAEWVKKTYATWGITNVSYDRFAPIGRGWTLKNFSAMVTAPVPFPVIAYPAAWSPGFKERDAEVVFLNVSAPADFDRYKGKLKGKFVLLSDVADVRPHFTPQATRLADSVLLRMANADGQSGRRGGRRFPRLDRMTPQSIDSALVAIAQASPEVDTAAIRERFTDMQLSPRKLLFAQEEGAIAAITPGRGDGGTMIVQSATVPQPQDTPRNQRISAYDPKAGTFIPQITFASEHYNRIIRMLKQGEKVTLEMELQVETTRPDSCFNIIAEIPGTDLKDEIVMLGGHFDTWHAGTGATDNNSGVAACMEAARVLTVLAEKHGLKTRRTIRIGFWGAEEQGLFGSREYVGDVFARREGDPVRRWSRRRTGRRSQNSPGSRSSRSTSTMTTERAVSAGSTCREMKPHGPSSAGGSLPTVIRRRRRSRSRIPAARTISRSMASDFPGSSSSRTRSNTTHVRIITTWMCTSGSSKTT